MRSRFLTMEKRFNYDPNALRLARITFWGYVVCILIIILIFLFPFFRGEPFAIDTYTIIYSAIMLFLLYSGYKVMKVMNSIKRSYCVVTDDRISGISTPDPFKPAVPFDIARADIVGAEKTTASSGGLRSHPALVLNTADRKIVLLSLERTDELIDELNNHQA